MGFGVTSGNCIVVRSCKSSVKSKSLFAGPHGNRCFSQCNDKDIQYVVFPNTTDRQMGRSSRLSSCCDVCHLYNLARKTWTVQIYVQRLQGMNVPINNSYLDNQRKRGCQLPDFHLMWNWRIHLLQGRASPHLFSTSDFSSHLYHDETIPQFPKVELMADTGPLVAICIFSPSSSHEGETSQYFAKDLSCDASCKLMIAHTSVYKRRPPLPLQILSRSCESSTPCLQLCFSYSLGTGLGDGWNQWRSFASSYLCWTINDFSCLCWCSDGSSCQIAFVGPLIEWWAAVAAHRDRWDNCFFSHMIGD